MRIHYIDSRPPRLSQRLAELWAYRELLLLLAWRDLRVRYAQTVVGVLWVVLQPLTTLVIFVFVFGRVLKLSPNNIPYSAWALPGIVAWGYFASVLRESGSVIIQSAAMVSKVYFPRLILPLSKALTAGVDLLVGLVLVGGVLLGLGLVPPLRASLLPLWLLLTLVSALGGGLVVAASTIRYRDFQHVLPFVVQVGLYISPIAWPIELVSGPWRTLLFLNPMTGAVEGLRWSLFVGYPPPATAELALSVGTSLLLLFSGLWAFGRAERRMADWV